MKRVLTNTQSSLQEKGSKFLGYLLPVENQDDFDESLASIKSKYPDATHHCYGWRLNPAKPEEFAQDDGEPGGAAGLPILNQLKSFEVINAGLVVVRYYGGTNLGKSGLIKAYGTAAELCLQKADLKPIEVIWKVAITYPYAEQNTIEKLIYQYTLKELDASYTEK
ncbi:MAG: YigZ family protein [Balneolaceae bacterium]|nr:YigZ family protein [Balneolaceae bacterium]